MAKPQKKSVGKKSPAKKSSGAKPAKKPSPASKASIKPKPIAGKASGKSSDRASSAATTKKTLAVSATVKSNGVSHAPKKTIASTTSNKKAASSAEPLHRFKAKANGTRDEKGLNPQTYQMLRQDLISTLWKYDEITFDELCAAMEKIHGKNFVNDSIKYLQQVVSDLINIDLIETVERGTNRSVYRIRQRLSE